MVTATNYGKVTVLTVKGELTRDTIGDFVEQRDQALAASRVHVAVDCSGVSIFDSAGLEALTAARRACEQLHGSLKVCGLDETGRKIFEITRLDRAFEIHDDLDAAVRSFV